MRRRLIPFVLREAAIVLGLTAGILLGLATWLCISLGVFALLDWMGLAL